MSTEIERRAKSLAHIVETFDQPVGDLRMQKLDGAAAGCTIAVPPPGTAVK
jgi:hypothetical protein